jgi:hypothetical protein
VSRRSKRRRDLQAAGEASAGGAPDAPDTGTERPVDRAGDAGGRTARSAAPTWGLGVQLAFLAAVFAVVVLVAELAGAANLGVALGIGQIAFAIAVMYLLVRR